MMRGAGVIVLFFLALGGIPAPGVAQWLHYPTPGVPRGADGNPHLSAPAPHLADGRPDFSGIWLAARKIPCTAEFSKFVECGLEIGGSPLALNIGESIQGGLPYAAWAGGLDKQRYDGISQ